MPRPRLMWKVAPVYLAVVLACSALLAWLAASSVRGFEQARVADDLREKVALAAPRFEPILKLTQPAAEARRVCGLIASASHGRWTLSARDGKVIADSHLPAESVSPLTDRPEFRLALAEGMGVASDRGADSDEEALYAATVIGPASSPLGVLRVGLAASDFERPLGGVFWAIALGGVGLASFAGAIMTGVFVRHVSRPLRALQVGARRFADGKLDLKVPVPASEEIGSLAEALNRMASRLHETIQTITQQSQERQAILSSMAEGVVAVDHRQRVLTLNKAATELLHVTAPDPRGLPISEVVRNAELRLFVDRVLIKDQTLTEEMLLDVDGQKRELQVDGAVMHGDGKALGAVVVLHDVTQLRKLESIRRDFVANVSHELKTPIAAIKAAVETLIDMEADFAPAHENTGQPALDHHPSRSPAARFMGIIARQSDRLNAIVDDLLALARIEQEEQGELAVEPCELRRVLVAAVETCHNKAEAKSMALQVEADPRVVCLANPALLEQSVTNLLDNAVKYGREGTPVVLRLEQRLSETVISVIDQGMGIEPQHLPRLFERFYRTDKARSRAVGGTGLGLAIVKHVAQAHRGRVTVESTLGKGSVFRIHLPRGDLRPAPASSAAAPALTLAQHAPPR